MIPVIVYGDLRCFGTPLMGETLQRLRTAGHNVDGTFNRFLRETNRYRGTGVIYLNGYTRLLFYYSNSEWSIDRPPPIAPRPTGPLSMTLECFCTAADSWHPFLERGNANHEWR
ncbi:MAG: hypothetical protein LBI39_02650 [Puniceicoccales bacterium]|nr:hypothetical protein [Puniceicoccales bacterium]